MSATKATYTKRKPVERPALDRPVERPIDDDVPVSPGVYPTKRSDLAFLSQKPRTPTKSPLRNSGQVSTSSSIQTTIVPVTSTIQILPTVTDANPQLPIGSERLSIDTSSTTVKALEEAESVMPISRRRPSDLTNSSASPIDTTSPPLSPRMKLPSLAIAGDLLASSEAMLQTPTPKSTSTSLMDTADDMLIQLLISQAVVDARDFEILSIDEVEELKKDHALLRTRIAALNNKLSLETKIREAANSLSRLHASNKRLSRQANDHLAQANRKVDHVASELWKLTQRAGEIQRKLLQHMAGIMCLGVRKLEEKQLQLQHQRQQEHAKPSLYEHQMVSVNNGIDHLYNELMGLEARIDPNLASKVSSLEANLQRAHKTLGEARISIKRKDKEIEELKSKFDDSSSEARERTIVELRTELEEVSRSLDMVLRHHKQAQRDTASPTTDEEDGDESDSGSSYNRLSTMTQNIQNEQYKNISKNLKTLEKILGNYQFKLYRVEQEMATVKQNAEGDTRSIESSLSNLVQERDMLTEALQEQQQAREASERRLAELEIKARQAEDLEERIRELDAVNEDRLMASQQRQELESQLAQVNQDYEKLLNSLRGVFDDLSTGKVRTSFSIDVFFSRIRNIKDENKRLMDSITMLQTQSEMLQSQLDKANEYTDAKQLLEETQRELEDTKERLQDAEIRAKEAKFAVSSSSEKESALQQKLLEVQQQFTEAKEKVRKYEATLKRQSIIQVINDGRSKHEELQQQIEAQAQEYEAQIKERDGIISRLRQDITNITSERDKASQVVKELEEMLSTKSRTLDRREVTINHLESDIVRFKTELAELKAATDGLARFNRLNADGETAKLKAQFEEAEAEIMHLRSVRENLEAEKSSLMQQIRRLENILAGAEDQFALQEQKFDQCSEKLQTEYDGILREFDRLTKNFIDFDGERQKLEGAVDVLQKNCERLENELADERIKHLGIVGKDLPTTATLRKEFRKMMADLRSEQQALLHREREEKKKLENIVRTLKRDKEAEKWERSNKGTQTRFVVSVP